MIGKPEWFVRRKYMGWGLMPVTWQGWVYSACVILPFAVLFTFKTVTQTEIAILIAWMLIVCADLFHIMIHVARDERDRIHEAIAERNAMWVMVIILTAGVAYQSASSGVGGIANVDPVILVAIVIGLATKAVSNIYLDKKD